MKYLVVTMPDHSRWRIPVQFIAEHRARFYVEHDRDLTIFDDEVAFCLSDEYELKDWASNNMNWSDVIAVADRIPDEPVECDYERAWVNAGKEILEMHECLVDWVI